MGVKNKKLKEWVSAGVLTQEQANAIQLHEDHKKRGHFGRGLINLSIFAILVGILSVIASNWQDIPAYVKIGVHVILNLGVGFVAFKADKMGKDVWREGATLALFGLTMTLIVLVGQVYQLTGSTGNAMSLWMLVTLPFMFLLGRTYGTAIPWLIAFVATIFFVELEYLPNLSESLKFYIFVGTLAYLPLIFLAGGRAPLVQKYKPAFGEVATRLGIFLLACAASFSIIVWGYISDVPSELSDGRTRILVIWLLGLVGFGLHGAVRKFYKHDEFARYMALFAVTSFSLALMPALVPDFGNGVFSAIIFIAYWIFIGWVGQMTGHMRIVSLAITVIAIRIYILYIELFFDNLMQTGGALILGGVVMLAMIYGARKLNNRLTKGGKNVTA